MIKLFYSSAISLICAGINFDTEARVTKEVAETALPYLMEAAEIPGDDSGNSLAQAKEKKYKREKIQAILDMIYTDEGQQQMVEWVKNGEFPEKLGTAGFVSAGTYANRAYREVSLASLFPCSTGTFTSFANHKSRLGSYVLSDTKQLIKKKI